MYLNSKDGLVYLKTLKIFQKTMLSTFSVDFYKNTCFHVKSCIFMVSTENQLLWIRLFFIALCKRKKNPLGLIIHLL